MNVQHADYQNLPINARYPHVILNVLTQNVENWAISRKCALNQNVQIVMDTSVLLALVAPPARNLVFARSKYATHVRANVGAEGERLHLPLIYLK